MRNIFLPIVIVVIIFFIASYYIYGTGNSEVKMEIEFRNEMVSKYCKDMNHSNQKKCNEQYRKSWNQSSSMRDEIIAGWKE